LSWAERIVQQMSRRGVRVLRPGNPDYPPQLKLLSAPPRVLYLLGESSRLRPPSAAIVGSTNPSPRGKFLAAEIARRLSRAGCTIVSGMAKGIDLAAHRAAIAAGGTTVFVLPTGILHFKPGAQFPPLDAWISRAAIISEWPPEAEWSASAAVARNRVIAALASAVVVVETQPEGGAMHTFRYAQELDRPLFVVKYRQPPPSASGNNAAIALGGTPLTQLSEVRHVIEAAKSGSSAACPP
jgi:DNA processing protein